MTPELFAGLFIGFIAGLFIKLTIAPKIDHIKDDYFIKMAREGWTKAKYAEERISELLTRIKELQVEVNELSSEYIKLFTQKCWLLDDIKSYRQQCERHYQRERELHWRLGVAVNKWAKAQLHIEEREDILSALLEEINDDSQR